MLFDVPPPLLEPKFDLIDFSEQKRGRSPLVIPPHNPVDFVLNFDGVNDYVNCGSDSSIDDISVITIEAWLFPMSFGENNAGRIVDKNQKLFFMSTDLAYIDTVSFYHGFSTTKGQWHTPDYSIVLNQWHHVAVVYDNSAVGNNPIIYINGIPQTVRERTAPIGTATSDAASSLTIGNRSSADRTFDGFIDSTRIYNRALSTYEIKQNYHENVTRTGLVSEWLFNRNAKDGAGVNDGAVIGATYVPRKRYKA